MNLLLVNARKKVALARNELADRLNVSVSTVTKVESGIRYPSARLAKKWSQVLSIPESMIFKYFFNYKQDNM